MKKNCYLTPGLLEQNDLLVRGPRQTAPVSDGPVDPPVHRRVAGSPAGSPAPAERVVALDLCTKIANNETN